MAIDVIALMRQRFIQENLAGTADSRDNSGTRYSLVLSARERDT